MSAAQADTTITVGLPTPIDYTETSDGVAPDENILNDASTVGAGAGTTNILSFQTIQGVATGTATTGDSDVSILSVAGDNSSFDADGNDIFSQVRGNNVSSSVGTSDATDGAVILNAQETVPESQTVPTDGTALSAFSDGNTVTITLLDDGQNVTAGVDDNSISARASFNTAFGTIETAVPTTLDSSTGAEYGATYSSPLLPDSIEQSADYSVASVQVNSGFENGQTDPVGTANIEGATIGLQRILLDGGGGVAVSGTYEVLENSATATTLGNAADNSVFLLSGEASSFDGSAIVSSTQVSRDLGFDTVEPPISATNDDSTIAAVFYNDGTSVGDDGPGGALFAIGDGLAVNVDDNTIGATASMNSSRNELGFDSALDLDGGSGLALVNLALDDTLANNGTGAGTLILPSPSLDFGVVNVQTALGGEEDLQSAYTLVEDAIIGIFIEDVDGDSVLSVAGNAVNSTASGNVGTNIIRNNGGDLGDGSPLVGGSFASVNQQYLSLPQIDADNIDGNIGVLIGSLNDGIGGAFGGLDSSTVTVDGNDFTATANGSVATGLIDLAGLSLDVARVVGAGIATDREDGGGDNFSGILTGSGVSITNLQLSIQDGDAEDGDIDSLVDNNEVFASINYDELSDDAAAEVVADSTVSVSDNSFVASSTANGFDGLVRLSANTAVAGDVAVGSLQTIDGTVELDIDTDVDDNDADITIGIGISASDLTVDLDGNSFLALLNGNDSNLTIDVTAGTTIEGRGIILDPGTFPTAPAPSNAYTVSSSVLAEETLNTEVQATAGYLIVSDQALTFVNADADADNNEVELFVETGDAGPYNLSNSTFSASDNTIIGQALGNTAGNAISLDAGTSITAVDGDGGGGFDPGALAGIFSSQTAATVFDSGDIDLDIDIDENEVDVNIMLGTETGFLSNVTVEANNNVIQGLGFMNVVGNSIVADANTIAPAAIDGVDLSAAIDVTDQQLYVADAGFFIVNRQRNEGIGPEDDPILGGEVDIDFGGDDPNEVTVDINGGSVGASSSTFSASSNGLLATGAANVANNLIDFSADTTAGAAAGILNRQGNSGEVDVDNDDSLISLTLTGEATADHSDVTLNLNQNVIGSSSTGSSASNVINASAGTTLNGTNSDPLDGVFVGSGPGATFFATVDTATGTVDTNADSFASGNLAILSVQRNYGVDDGGIIPSEITSRTDDAVIELTVDGVDVDSDNLTLTLNGNVVRSQAVANAAGNVLNVDSGTGGPASATVLNNQGAAITEVSASVSDSDVTGDVDGEFNNGTIGVINNAIVASADLNNATNTITASAAVGIGLESSTVANYQSAGGSSVSTSVTGSSISTTSGDIVGGGVSNSTVTASGNQIGTSSTINNSVNRIASPGQGFTRTSTF